MRFRFVNEIKKDSSILIVYLLDFDASTTSHASAWFEWKNKGFLFSVLDWLVIASKGVEPS